MKRIYEIDLAINRLFYFWEFVIKSNIAGIFRADIFRFAGMILKKHLALIS
jgi:hypothetical protein